MDQFPITASSTRANAKQHTHTYTHAPLHWFANPLDLDFVESRYVHWPIAWPGTVHDSSTET